jgi:hypothetical protein
LIAAFKRGSLAALWLLPMLCTAGGTATKVTPRVIEIIASHDDTFHVKGESQPVLTAKPDERLLLRITAQKSEMASHDGAVHSFVIKSLRDQGWDIRLHEGTNDYLVSAPAQTGEYLVECTVRCGPGHDHMQMKLLVRQ